MNSEAKRTKSIFSKSSRSLRVDKSPHATTNTQLTEGTRCNSAVRNSSTAKVWIIPKQPRTYLSKGISNRRKEFAEFAYDLSPQEYPFAQKFSHPMKALSSEEKELQQSGVRTNYLNTRYERAPVQKYNFPEATSWRIGWFHNQRNCSE